MVPDLRSACDEMFGALAIVSPDTLRLYGTHYRCHPDRLVTALLAAIYTHFYCKLTRIEPCVSEQGLRAALSEANRGSPSHASAAFEQPGAYVAVGRAHSAGTRWLRCYWNVDHRGAIRVMASATTSLTRRQVPFRLKVLLDVTVRRSDAVVLYIPIELWSAGGMVISDVYDALAESGTVHPETPLFTKAVRPGVGIAEDPATGQSFGMHRSALVARAMGRSYLAGRRGSDQWDDLRDEFASEHLSLAHPHLNAGSRDVYAI